MAITINTNVKDMKSIRNEFKKNGVFYSSLDLAEKLKSYVPEDVTEVYDPTCGSGALLSVFGDDVKKYGQELDEQQAQYAQEHLVNAEIVAGNTLTDPAFMGKKFRAIVANPPFSVKWEPNAEDERFKVAPALAPKSKADYAFILHCLHYLADDGKAVCLDAHGILFRGNAEGQIRKWLLENNYIEKIVGFGAGYFVDTSIPTCALILNKSKKTTDIVFEDTVINKGRVVKLEEIVRNDFNLNLSRYIQEERPKVKYDFLKENNNLREEIKEKLRCDIELQYILCKELDLGSFNDFIFDLEQIIKNGKHKNFRPSTLF